MKSTLPGVTSPWLALAGVGGALALLAAYLVACHLATVHRSPWAPWLYFVPVLAMLLSALAGRWGAVVAAGVVVPLLGVLAWGLPNWQGDLNLLYVIQHVCTNLALCWMFGHTLLGEREPLVTRFARILRRGDMPPQVMSFTRSVTLAWMLFFAGIALVSTGFYLLASIEAWSMFSNLINSPLVGLMFAGEYAVRRYKLRGIRHSSILGSLHMFRQGWPEAKPVQTPHEQR